MGVTDCHVHINPIWEMRPAALSLLEREGANARLDEYLRDPSAFLRYLDRSGIDRAVLVNYVARQVVGYTEATNTFISEYTQRDRDRLIAIGSVLPTHPAPRAEIGRLAGELGIRGIKIHPPHQLFAPNAYLNDELPGLREIYAACEELHLPVIFHTGTSIFPGARNKFGNPLMVEDVALDFPQLTIVLAHGGRPMWMNEALFLARRFPKVYLEVSSIPPARILEYFPTLERISDKVLFGSDWPGPGVKDIGSNLRAFRSLPLSRDCLDRILYSNPDRVFSRRGASPS
ncbi:MAG: amidohydrolase family protein [Thermoplasmata archaeon]